MLRNTFCHIPGIGHRTEQLLWSHGIRSWEDLLATQSNIPLVGPRKLERIKFHIDQSINHLEKPNPGFFSGLLPPKEHWRLFPDFRGSVVYLDIETSGLYCNGNYITTIALYDGESIKHYVRGDNLPKFKRDIQNYDVIITYNGKCFDVPFISSYFKINIHQTHIDLRYVLKSLGYKGGLKRCEKRLGINREDLEGIDGFFAVLLWKDFKQNKNTKALETLLAYNIQDVLSLENLMVIAYNKKLKKTPFHKSHRLMSPKQPDIPFKADRKTVGKIMRRRMQFWGT